MSMSCDITGGWGITTLGPWRTISKDADCLPQFSLFNKASTCVFLLRALRALFLSWRFEIYRTGFSSGGSGITVLSELNLTSCWTEVLCTLCWTCQILVWSHFKSNRKQKNVWPFCSAIKSIFAQVLFPPVANLNHYMWIDQRNLIVDVLKMQCSCLRLCI